MFDDNTAQNMFYGCTSLTDCGGFTDIVTDLDLSYSPLTHQSAVNIINELGEAPGNRILKLSRPVSNTLSSAEIAVATEKKWTIQSA